MSVKNNKKNSSYGYAKTCMGNIAGVITKPDGAIAHGHAFLEFLIKNLLILPGYGQTFNNNLQSSKISLSGIFQ